MPLTDIESEILQRHRSGEPLCAGRRPEGREDWVRLGLAAALDAGGRIRAIRQDRLAGTAQFKQDATPYTRVEATIEDDLRSLLRELVPEAAFVGEEAGGEWSESGLCVAIDPIDGTWAFINHSETFTTSLAVFEDGEVLVGIIVNPSTGELAYSAVGQTARLIQLSMLGERDVGADLPLEPPGPTMLVNVHPSRSAGALMGRLFHAWSESDLQMAKAPGGSPSWALVEAAKGRFTYINLWARRAADPFDLAPGIALVRAAGGDVVDAKNRPVELSGHAGPFVAAIDPGQREQAVSIVAGLEDAGEGC
jgi:fructose-1,6-bisphosphatase/inositol monophosphatase family enzyme